MPDQQGPSRTMRDVSFREFCSTLSNTPEEVARTVFDAAMAHHSRAGVAWGHCKGHREVAISGSDVTFVYAEDDRGCLYVMCLFGSQTTRDTAFIFEEGADLPELTMNHAMPFVLGPATMLESWMIRSLEKASQYKRSHPHRALTGAR